MDKFKKITLYALTAALLATSCPWQAFAERNQPVAPPPVTASPGNDDSGFGNKDGNKSNKNDVQNGKHRYNLDTVGLDKNGKKSLENTPSAIDLKNTWRFFITGPD